MTEQQTWEERAERCLSLRSGQGRPLKVVREVYLRPDVPCFSPMCLAGCRNDSDALLPKDASHYIVPECRIAKDYLELFELTEMQGVVFTQTAAHCVQHEGSRRLAARLRRLVQDPNAGCILFCNEFQKYAHCLQEPQESVAEWRLRSTYRAAEWLFDHLAGQVPLVMVTQTEEEADVYRNQKMGVLVVSFKQYIAEFWKGHTAIMELYTSLSEAAVAGKEGKQFGGYLPQAALEEALKSGRFVSGRLNVNRFNAVTEAFVARSGVDLTEDSGADVLIVGAKDRNRAVHGDEVVVDIFPKSQWRTRSLAVKIEEENEVEDNDDDDDDEAEKMKESGDKRLPTGRVVGVLKRQWRDYVASLSPNEQGNTNSNKSGKVLVIPWDYRIPKIRIATRQVNLLKEQRCLVRIDNWPSDSQYPNGHLVKALGPIGDLETEIAALLAENELSTSAFTSSLLAELPTDSSEEPWVMSAEEEEQRRDLRQSHLVFSIDPKGCEDVDDTLSLRELENGNVELGVHIADVTFFVQPGSLTDREAQERSTTIYLADRRYDMLPGILSANLCSLISGKDRYAVSVMWELTPKFEVVNVWYGRTIIHSKYKLFYEMAQEVCNGCSDQDILDNVPEFQGVTGEELTQNDQDILDNVPEFQGVTGKELTQKLKELRWSLIKLTELGRSLKARRTHCGALDLESVEVQVQLTETKGVEDLTPKEHLEVHETIAECMIFANHWVAKKIADAFPSKALLRNHPPPRQEQFDNLLKCATARGFYVDTSSNKALAASLDACVDAKDPLVNSLLRSLATLAMSNARYFCTGAVHPDEFMHYGLALDRYTHFTSPIRRYADVIVHRQLLAAVKQEAEDSSCDETRAGLPGSKRLDEMADHMNNKHRAAQNAQRDSQELFQSIFFRDHDDDDSVCIADAVIYQLRANGVLVFVPRYGVKGVAYLQDRNGQVLYIPKSCPPEWVSGALTRGDDALTVDSTLGLQKYCLLEHITVRLSVNLSHAHCQSLKIEVVAKRPHGRGDGGPAEVTTRADMVKRVKQGAEDKQGDEMDTQSLLDSLSPELSQYRQTDPQHSLYNLFQSFHHTSMQF